MPEFLREPTRQVIGLWRQIGWLPDWGATAILVLLLIALGLAAHELLFAVLRWAVRNRDVFWRGVVQRARKKLRLAMLIVVVALGITVSPTDPVTSDIARRTLLFGFILVAASVVQGAMDMWAVVYMRRFNINAPDNLIARKHVTQVRILQRVAAAAIWLLALGLALMTIPGFRQWGMSLLASAGVVGLVAGLALQPFLTNLVAGIQIALTQPIRVDDAVIVEGEWGNIEEIGSTYVVVRIWDLRRLVVPLTYFTSKPFQNWTRESAELIGAVELWVDYRADIDAMRAAFMEMVKASALWDGKTAALQVIDATERTLKARCLASASDGGRAWDLRCEIREKLAAWLRDHQPEALPRDRIELERESTGRRVQSGEEPAITRQ
ncbi:mechanosensitive ion channel family protein [Brevundimonas sp. 2R-24]|uniref:Mechanosensitive ion channel family protein n=1 Tax=Peiella sedimenti TaxID=3061083 RepID=A0ABT8SMF3_9CAUL|nr:mechanosensitive ion channel family protein [Caulobacteraceae bacterium XZ-24]